MKVGQIQTHHAYIAETISASTVGSVPAGEILGGYQPQKVRLNEE